MGNYVSTVADFKRRLRIRMAEVDENGPMTPKKATSRRKQRGSMAAGAQAAAAAVVIAKPWLVEGSGTFFESPTSLQSTALKEGGRYFIAVAQDVAQTVQQEGYKVQRRFSIPCSATPQEALMAWSKNEQRCDRKGTKAVALAVVIPPEIDVITHRKGGFLIRCTELPPSCFRAKKVAPAAAGTNASDAKADAS